MQNYDVNQIAQLVEKVVISMRDMKDQLGQSNSGENGIFEDAESAITAAKTAQKKLMLLSLDQRKKLIQGIRDAAYSYSEDLAAMELRETGMGRLDNKIFKIQETIFKTPGVENIVPETFSGGWGITMIEKNPWGVCGCILPSTAPAATAIHNGICMIAAGNSAVMCPHPNASKTALETISLINKAIVNAGGPENLIATFRDPSIENSNKVMHNPEVKIILVTGGPGVVKAAFASGKRAICAGPGNPPVLVDGTTDLAVTAQYIFNGCSFENCINCIGEKSVFVLNNFADTLISELVEKGCYLLRDSAEIEKLTNLVTNKDGSVNKKYVGKDAKLILRDIGIEVGNEIKVIIFEAPHDHIIVMEEYLMPLLPIVRVDTVDQGILYATEAEGGRRHSAVVHSANIDVITKYINTLRTTVMAINGSSYNAVGMEGEGYVTMSIATATGEGLTCPNVFTRHLRKAVVNGLGQYVVK